MVIGPAERRLPVFGNPKCPCASLTGGTQFATVNQSFTKPLAGLSSANGYDCRQEQFSGSGRIAGRRRAREGFHSQDGSVARKSQVVRTDVSATNETGPGVPDLMLQNLLFRIWCSEFRGAICRNAFTSFLWPAGTMGSCARSLSPCIISTSS